MRGGGRRFGLICRPLKRHFVLVVAGFFAAVFDVSMSFIPAAKAVLHVDMFVGHHPHTIFSEKFFSARVPFATSMRLTVL